MSKNNLSNKEIDALENLFNKASNYIHEAKIRLQRSINTEMVRAYWLIGHDIVEAEQHGEKRADYGRYLIQNLSEKLTKQFGKGFSVSTLKDIRQFYLVYSDLEISHALRGQSAQEHISVNLGWTHYRALMRVDRKEARKFYEIEAEKNYWSGRQLERQINTLLYDRLAKSKDKEGLLKLANEGKVFEVPEDAIKEPLILAFLGIPESHRLAETNLENWHHTPRLNGPILYL